MTSNLLGLPNPFRSKNQRMRKRVPCAVISSVENLEERALLSTFTVNGDIKWTDGGGGLHAAPLVTVEVHRLGAGNTDGGVLATGTTNLVGHYSINVNTGAGTEATDVYVKVLSRSVIADVKNAAGTTTHSFEQQDSNNVANGGSLTKNLTANNTTDAGKSFSVNNALVVCAQYTGNLTGWVPSTIDVRFDSTVAGSSFTYAGRVLRVRGSAWNEWDPIHHELGHYVQNQYGFESNPGGPHSSAQNLASQRGSKDIGVRLAWGEGWPTFFAISGQIALGTSSLNVPQVGDAIYQAWNGGVINDLEAGSTLGEDNEFTVMSVLWDLWDATNEGLDDVTLSDRAIFNVLNSSNATTLGGAWEAIAGPRSVEERTKIGAVFAQNGVAPDLLLPLDGEDPGGEIPEFSWIKNGGGVPNPNNDFRIRFYTADFGSIVFEKALGDVDEFIPTAEEWGQIAAEGTVKWVIEGRNTSNPATPGGTLGYYWSEARTIGSSSTVFVIDDTGSMGEEIDSVVAALQDYIDLVELTLPDGALPPSITVITFKDDVTVRLTSNDLNEVRNVVGSLYASGGGDCPEASAAALAVAADLVGFGGTILLATDASTHPGTDFGAIISQLRAKSVSVNVILSGDCGPIESEGPASAAFASSSIIVQPDEHEDDDDCDCDDSDGECHCNDAAVWSTSESYVRPSMSSSEDSPSSAGTVSEPSPDGSDDDVDPGEFIFDPGQAPIDDFGNSPEEAATLTLNSIRVGSVGREGDDYDYFKIDLTGGETYTLTATSFNFDYGYIEYLDTDGTTVLNYDYPYDGSVSFNLDPSTTGTYYLRMSEYYGGSTIIDYSLIVTTATDGPLGDVSAVTLYSTVAAETGGAFLVRDDVNSGDSDGYVAALFNVFASTLGPAVLSANPDSAPAEETVAVTLTARGTNWLPGNTTVEFSDPGLVVQSVQVTSATTLTAIVQISGTVLPDLYDVTVETNLGGEIETAEGVNVLLVTEPIEFPTILGADPGTLFQGDTGTIVIRGALVNWNTGTVTVDLGEGVTTNSVTVNSATQLTVNYTVDDDASIAFRTVTVSQTAQTTLSKERAFFVSAEGIDIAKIVDISEDSALPGTTLNLTVTGENTHFVNGDTTASLGQGVTVNSVNVTSATTATLNITVDAGAALGFRNVVLTTDSETAVLLAGFFVGDGATQVGGDVDVTVGKKTLTITGDEFANHVLITVIDSKTIRVEGKDGTKINGQTGPVNFAAKSVSIVSLGDGDDELRIVSNRANAVRKSASLNMGAGDDTVRLEHLTIKGRARLTLGAGEDHLALLDTVFSSQTTSDFNQLEDTFEELASTNAKAAAKERSSKHAGRSNRKGRGRS